MTKREKAAYVLSACSGLSLVHIIQVAHGRGYVLTGPNGIGADILALLDKLKGN